VIIIGEQLTQLCSSAQREILLVAPFIKRATLERLLASIRDDVPVRCVTRWRPEEIAQGVSDLEVWEILRERKGSNLWVRNNLHAKYYRADQNCLVGSANLTHTALGWSTKPNFELLIDVSSHSSSLVAFESQLFDSCLQVDDAFFRKMSEAVQLIKTSLLLIPTQIAVDAIPPQLSISTNVTQPNAWWTPMLRNPEDLYLYYSGKLESLTSSARPLAEAEFDVFDIPSGLSKEAFISYCSVLLLEQLVVQRIDEFLSIPQRFGAVRDLLQELPCANNADFDATYTWQTLIRWFMYFLPDRYIRIPSRHSEVYQRRY
jgi:hypothetical protein